MAARTYIMDAARSVTTGAIDGGERPSVPAGILKYHVTEFGRMVGNDAMDVQGGKGIMLGPKNHPSLPDDSVKHHGRGRKHPDAQPHHFRMGAVRCHPWIRRR
jgi:acyl-CoA dehydrogenase